MQIVFFETRCGGKLKVGSRWARRVGVVLNDSQRRQKYNG